MADPCPKGNCDTLVETIRALTSNSSNDAIFLARHPKSDGRVVSEHLDWKRVHDAAGAGCRTCGILCGAILCFFSEPDLTSLNPRIYLTAFLPKDSEQLISTYMMFNSDLNWHCNHSIYLYAPENAGLCHWPLLPAPTPADSFTLEGRLRMISSWLSDCRSMHVTCRSYGGGLLLEDLTPLPKRVLDVWPADCDLRLYESCGEMHRYICLSHRWGKSQPLRTTSATLKAWKENIPWDKVPKVFQDAVLVTRKLGIRYLWIDSLCIVQDDAKDWNEQAFRMCSIYQNAFLTIAATRALGCEDTLFPLFEHTVDGLDQDGNPHQVAVRILDDHLMPTRSSDSLLTRGWFFQEQLLSRRMLHFGHDELFWECMESSTCECWVVGYSYSLKFKSIRTRIPESGTDEHKRSIWQQLVSHYSGLSLTKVSDRQMAILGLVAEMQPHRKGKYLAGLWEDTLISDLAWQQKKLDGNPRPPQTLTRAPTWSWASVDGTCEYLEDWRNSDTTVLAIQAPDLENFLDDRQALGCLTLSGSLVTGTSDNSTGRGWDNWFSKTFAFRGRANFTFDYNHLLNTESERCFSDSKSEIQVPDGTPVFCLSLGSATLTIYERAEIGLVLLVVDEEQSLYERVGLAWLRPPRIPRVSLPSLFSRGVNTTVRIV